MKISSVSEPIEMEVTLYDLLQFSSIHFVKYLLIGGCLSPFLLEHSFFSFYELD
jgi:hypothetical protein